MSGALGICPFSAWQRLAFVSASRVVLETQDVADDRRDHLIAEAWAGHRVGLILGAMRSMQEGGQGGGRRIGPLCDRAEIGPWFLQDRRIFLMWPSHVANPADPIGYVVSALNLRGILCHVLRAALSDECREGESDDNDG
jgi:hypothetical protein